jgi:hypothetical protein
MRRSTKVRAKRSRFPIIANGEVWTRRRLPSHASSRIRLRRRHARPRRAGRPAAGAARCAVRRPAAGPSWRPSVATYWHGVRQKRAAGACRRPPQAVADAAAPQLPGSRGALPALASGQGCAKTSTACTGRSRHPRPRLAAGGMSGNCGNSRFISSAQEGPHRDLEELVRRHMAHPFRKPILDYNREAFATPRWPPSEAWRSTGAADSRCRLRRRLEHAAASPRQFPDHFVFRCRSVESTASSRGKPLADASQCRLVRADLVDFWRLLAENGIRLARHYNLYPESVAEDRPSRPALARPRGVSGVARAGRRSGVPQQLAHLHRGNGAGAEPCSAAGQVVAEPWRDG